MTASDGRSTAELLAGSLHDAAVLVDASDRVLACNAAATTRLGITGADTGRTLAQLGLGDRPGASRLSLAGASAEGAAAIVVWPAEPSNDDVALQKMRAMARLARGVTHEGRNQLAGFRSFFGLLRTDEAFIAEYGTAMIDGLEENARLAPELLSAFAELARDRRPDPAPQPLRSSVREALVLLEFAMDVRRAVDMPNDLPDVLADRGRLHQALVAVLVNTLDALGGPRARGSVVVTATALDGGGGGLAAVRLVFEDDAPTVPPADRAHLFDRVPPPGCSPRAGLDLAVARRLLEADGGTLDHEPGPEGGNRFIVTLPCAPGEPPAAPGTAPSPTPAVEPRSVPLTVLVCDDEPPIRDLMIRVLERSHFRVLGAASAAEALTILEREHVDVVMSDHNMSEMSGVELYGIAGDRHPHLRGHFVLMSGDPGNLDLVAFSTRTGLPVLAKPFTFAELNQTIREVVGS